MVFEAISSQIKQRSMYLEHCLNVPAPTINGSDMLSKDKGKYCWVSVSREYSTGYSTERTKLDGHCDYSSVVGLKVCNLFLGEEGTRNVFHKGTYSIRCDRMT